MTGNCRSIPLGPKAPKLRGVKGAQLAPATTAGLALVLLVYAGGVTLPIPVATAVELSLIGITLIMLPGSLRISRRLGAASILMLFIPFIWTSYLLNDNVPSLTVGLLGIRKSCMVFVGIALGLSIKARGSVDRILPTISIILPLILITSLTLHLLAPELEANLRRQAESYTSVFQGVTRLQGILAGPFHVALLACTLFLISWQSLRWGRGYVAWGLSGLLIAGYAIVLTRIRTAYLVAALGLIFLTVLYRKRNTGPRVAQLVLVGGLVAVFGATLTSMNEIPVNPVLASIPNLATDHRALARIDTWNSAAELILRSPVYGWGPGSAADTMGSNFVGRHHVTPHNIFIKYLVEGGIIGGLAVLAALTAFLFNVDWSPCSRHGQLACIAALCLLGFGLTTSIVEALPVTFILGMIIGFAVRQETPHA